ncbi:MAG: hypothetical protein ACYSWQ_28875 [Planctomycetota bacterium]|jgi:uncharacterized membrane-anchored protein YhcB (DUF1043 family)
MTQTTLAFAPAGAVEAFIALIGTVVPVVLAILFFRLMLRNKRENMRLRLEVGKLADELEKARRQEGTEAGAS